MANAEALSRAWLRTDNSARGIRGGRCGRKLTRGEARLALAALEREKLASDFNSDPADSPDTPCQESESGMHAAIHAYLPERFAPAARTCVTVHCIAGSSSRLPGRAVRFLCRRPTRGTRWNEEARHCDLHENPHASAAAGVHRIVTRMATKLHLPPWPRQRCRRADGTRFRVFKLVKVRRDRRLRARAGRLR